MKNLKNMVSALSLAAVLAVGATATNAGIIMSDRSVAPANEPCTTTATTATTGIYDTVIAVLEGIIMSDRAQPTTCQTTNRDGIIMSD